MLVKDNRWASEKFRLEGFEAREAYFVYSYRGQDGLARDHLIACDFFVPNGSKDGLERVLMFPCPQCEFRHSHGQEVAGEWLRYIDRGVAQARNELTVRSSLRDFDVAENKWVDFEVETYDSQGRLRLDAHRRPITQKKRFHGLAVVSGRMQCPDCIDDAAAGKEVQRFDVVFTRVGHCHPYHDVAMTQPSPNVVLTNR